MSMCLCCMIEEWNCEMMHRYYASTSVGQRTWRFLSALGLALFVGSGVLR
jgi:hypothetical protein